nr:hypothetical protein [Tanacetum cinerariifolium]
PKPKASVKRTRSSSDTSITPPTAAASPRRTTSVKGKQTAKASKAKTSSFSADEGTGSVPGVPDAATDESKKELSWNSTDDEGADNEGMDGDDDEEDKVSTEMEVILEHTQQGISHEVSVSTEGVEESKRNVKIKGVKKEALRIH